MPEPAAPTRNREYCPAALLAHARPAVHRFVRHPDGDRWRCRFCGVVAMTREPYGRVRL